MFIYTLLCSKFEISQQISSTVILLRGTWLPFDLRGRGGEKHTSCRYNIGFTLSNHKDNLGTTGNNILLELSIGSAIYTNSQRTLIQVEIQQQLLFNCEIHLSTLHKTGQSSPPLLQQTGPLQVGTYKGTVASGKDER